MDLGLHKLTNAGVDLQRAQQLCPFLPRTISPHGDLYPTSLSRSLDETKQVLDSGILRSNFKVAGSQRPQEKNEEGQMDNDCVGNMTAMIL